MQDIDMRDLALLVELIEGGHDSRVTGMPATEFHLDRTVNAIYRRLSRLEKKGYVGRGYSVERAYTYFITQEGNKKFREAKG